MAAPSRESLDYTRWAAVRAGPADVRPLFPTTDLRQALPVIVGYARPVDALVTRGAKVVVFPEKTPTLAASVKVRHDATVCARYGDGLAWLCVIGAAGVLGRLAVLETRESSWTATG